jgi:hypothetical protein
MVVLVNRLGPGSVTAGLAGECSAPTAARWSREQVPFPELEVWGRFD